MAKNLRQSWYQLDNEDDEQYTAFVTYYSTRSISETAEVMRCDPEVIRRWYEENDWGLRIDEYAFHLASSAGALSMMEESRQWKESREADTEDAPDVEHDPEDLSEWMTLPEGCETDDDDGELPFEDDDGELPFEDDDGELPFEDDDPVDLKSGLTWIVHDDDAAEADDDEDDEAVGFSSVRTWERMAGESSRAYGAFCVYRDMGRGCRNLRAAAAKMGRSRQLLERWSRQYDWVARAAMYDDEIDKRAMTQAVEDRKAMIRKQDELSILMMDIGMKAIQAKDPEDLSARDAITLMKEGAVIARAIRSIEWKSTLEENTEQISREDYAYKSAYHAGRNLFDALA